MGMRNKIIINDRPYSAISWCKENVGKRGKDWSMTFGMSPTYSSIYIFKFSRKSNALMFALRWS